MSDCAGPGISRTDFIAVARWLHRNWAVAQAVIVALPFGRIQAPKGLPPIGISGILILVECATAMSARQFLGMWCTRLAALWRRSGRSAVGQ